MSEFVRTTIEQAVATVTLDRPELHNAFNEVVIAELTATFEAMGRDDSVRAVVFASTGKSFSAGADVNWMKRMVAYSQEENLADAKEMAKMLRTIRDCPAPVIARVHGACFGGGVGIVAACDMSVAISNATFCLSEVRLGIIPAVISPFVLEKIGPGAARRYAITAERFDGVEAKRIGLINEAVETADELDPWIEGVTSSIKANGPRAVAACKRVLTDVVGFPWDEAQAMTAQRIAKLRVSPEGQEGLNAFLEKRTPDWGGADSGSA